MTGFRHEALIYSGEAEFLAGTVPFLWKGVEAGEPALAVLPRRRLGALQDALGPAREGVLFADMNDVGRNPACIIPAWQDFVERHSTRGGLRGIGEPVLPERSPAALLECQVHERLLNVAFDDGPGWTLLCPYDRDAFPEDVLLEAHRSHRWISHGVDSDASSDFAGDEYALDWPLPELAAPAFEIELAARALADLRRLADRCAARAGLPRSRADRLLFAVNEAATNAIRHGEGDARARLWSDGGEVVCEVTNRGRIADPLAGRRRPRREAETGRGLWLLNHLCDLVELRSSAAATTVRLHVAA